MPLDLQIRDDFTQRRLQRQELRYRRAQMVLAGAQAAYESLRDTPYADESRLRQALQRIDQAQEALVDIQSVIECLEDRENVTPAPACPVGLEPVRTTPPGAVPHAPAGESNRA
jgi:hypothetical protein